MRLQRLLQLLCCRCCALLLPGTAVSLALGPKHLGQA